MNQQNIHSSRQYDRNGWFTVASNPISKVGVFEYRGASIGAPDPNKIYNVYRPASELSRQETIDSFKLLPFVDDHAMLGKATPTSIPVERKGAHGTTGDNVVFDAATGTLNANLKVWSDSLQKTIDKGKVDISMGYLAQYRAEQGVFDGKHYDYVQCNILGNHAALVQDGRMGRNIAVLDALQVTFDTKDISTMDISTMFKSKRQAIASLFPRYRAAAEAVLEHKIANSFGYSVNQNGQHTYKGVILDKQLTLADFPSETSSVSKFLNGE